MIGKTPNTFIVGAGPVATVLAGGLRLAGVPVLGLWARRPEPARVAGNQSGVAAFSSAPPDLLLEANVVIVAVRDQAIAEVATMLVGTGLVGRSHVLVHCSGAVSAVDAFAPVLSRVGGVATLHPLRSITNPRLAMRDLTGTVFGIEGDAEGLRVVGDLVTALSGTGMTLDGGKMAAYHAAAATASNFVVALMEASRQILETSGISGRAAQTAMVALAKGSLDNVAAQGTKAALTGPIQRGDATTVARHLAILEDVSPTVRDAYRSLARLTLELARDDEADDAQREGLITIEHMLGD